MQRVRSCLGMLVLVGCFAGPDESPEPEAIAGCTTCAPGDVTGGTFFPGTAGSPRWLRATPNGTLVQVIDDTRLGLLDEGLAPGPTWSLDLGGDRVLDLAVGDALEPVALVRHSTRIDDETSEHQLTLRSFDAVGGLRWSRVIHDPWSGSLTDSVAIAGDLALVSGSPGHDERLTAYSLLDGSERWRVDGQFNVLGAGGQRVVAIEIDLAPDGWVFLLRVFDLAGGPVWQRNVGNASFPYHVAIDPAGRVALVASHGGGLDLGNGPFGPRQAWFVALFEPDGQLAWAHEVGRSLNLEYHAIAATSDGVAVAGAFYSSSFDVAGPPIFPVGHDAVALWVDAAGVRWRAIANGTEAQIAHGVVATGDRVISTIDAYAIDAGPVSSRFGDTVVDGTGTAFVGHLR